MIPFSSNLMKKCVFTNHITYGRDCYHQNAESSNQCDNSSTGILTIFRWSWSGLYKEMLYNWLVGGYQDDASEGDILKSIH